MALAAPAKLAIYMGHCVYAVEKTKQIEKLT